MKRERLFWLDFIRALATVLIVLTHYNALYIYNVTPPMPEKAVLTMYISNIYTGDLGVSLFLIVSGASLMYVYGEKCEVLTFYKKRFLNIYPMFWMAYIAVFLYNFYTYGIIPQGIPYKNFMFTVLGIDKWLVNFSVPTFELVAEWFLGLIIIIYLVFPLLRVLVNKHPKILAVIAVIMYVISLCTVNKSVTLFARLPEFLFGMYFVKYIKKVNCKWAASAALVLILNAILKPTYNNMIQVTYIGICAFVVLVWISYFIKANWVKSVSRTISKYSYACFIIHHVVMCKMVEHIDLSTLSLTLSWLLFGYICIMVSVATYILYHVHDKVVATLKRPYN